MTSEENVKYCKFCQYKSVVRQSVSVCPFTVIFNLTFDLIDFASARSLIDIKFHSKLLIHICIKVL